MFILNPDNIVYFRQRFGSERVQTYKIGLLATAVSCFLAAIVTVLRAVLIHWIGDDLGIISLQQALIGLSIASIAATSGILYSLIGKGENKNDSTSSK